MELLEAIEKRYSCRTYSKRPIKEKALDILNKKIAEYNKISGLNMQLMLNDEDAFKGLRKSYGMVSGVSNYIALVGGDGTDTMEKIGYYGEKIILIATQMGLGTCWVGGTYSKKDCNCEIKVNETLHCVITIGYPAEKKRGIEKLMKNLMSGKRKPINDMHDVTNEPPEWFIKGMEAVQKAPSAVNKQPVMFHLNQQNVTATVNGEHYQNIDLGIAKLHFEIGAGKSGWKWGQ